ncbi:MAG: carboxylate--amine ligase, partial [Deltaproteobacteria bacterium]|nr:carboxylate--amine ligase [Deltaproteobacteria bacterium]
DCTIQRRFQKIIEEAPAFIEERLVLETSERIKNYFNSIDFFGVATVEFLYEGDQLYFLEINPRLQVEHTVTEEIFNVDIVNLQFLIAMNESFNVDPKCVGHSIQLRINAEKGLDLLPAQGIFESLKYPASRVEATYSQGTVVNSHFDSLVAKLIVSAKDRRECLKKAIRALMDLEIRGVETNQALLLLILTTHDFISNSHHTDWLESKLKEWKDDNRFNLLNKALSDSLSSDQGGGVFKGCFRFKKENDFLKIDLNLA